MRKLVIRLQAQLDAEDAARWYESRRSHLGLRFLDELDSALIRIGASPLQFPEIEPGIRRGLVKRFPYSVYFLTGADRVEVIAVLHHHRRPDRWRNRL